MNWSGVRTIITYTQTTTPASPLAGETWLQNYDLYVRDSTNAAWIKITSFSSAPYGYVAGDYSGSVTYIQRFSFPFDSGRSVDNLNAFLVVGGGSCGNQSSNSSVHGYMSGAINGQTQMQRFVFPFDSGTASSIGTLTRSWMTYTGCPNSSAHGFVAGGYGNLGARTSTIDRFAFPFDSGTSTAVGILSRSAAIGMASYNSSNHGYFTAGVLYGTVMSSTIDRIIFPFASGTASAVGLLTVSSAYSTGFNSSLHGYTTAGQSDEAQTNHLSTIQRIIFPFDSGTATAVGALTASKRWANGVNSSIYGYTLGGYGSSYWPTSIERIAFPFNSGTATVPGFISAYTGFGGTSLDQTDFVTQLI